MTDTHNNVPAPAKTIRADVAAGLVVFLVALPLCLGIALASGAPLPAGLLAGIVGGIVVGLISGSHTSVSGPAAGLTAIVVAQIAAFGGGAPGFRIFLLAVFFAGLIQIAMGIARAGIIAAFFPTSVIKGLLAAIGVLLILKQIPHLLGHDADPEGDFDFMQTDEETTASTFVTMFGDLHMAAAAIGLLSIALLVLWDRLQVLKKSVIPAPLIVVVVGVGLNLLLKQLFGEDWAIDSERLVQVPVTETFADLGKFLAFPDFAQLGNAKVYTAALVIALVASLETLLNLEAVDKLDPQQRVSPASRELVAQGAGNIILGLIGGLPVTSVVVRGSVNVNAGAQSKLSAIFHGVLLLTCVLFLAEWLNKIPLSCLAAILLVTGIKLASPKLVKQMWDEGVYQFAPFAITVIAIVLTDLLVGILIGMAVSLSFILKSNLRRPIRRWVEKHLGGDVLHITLANQVSFLNRAALVKVLGEVPRGGHILLDAQNTDYIDPDVLDLIRDFKEQTAPARGIEVSFLGFRRKYHLEDQIQYVDYSTRELQSRITPAMVLQILKDGNERFRTGRRLTRDLGRQVLATAQAQHPLGVVLSCIDSRSPAELVFDLGVGDIFSVRVAGNVISRKVLGSMEYACAVAGAKLILVMGHTRCGAVTAAVKCACSEDSIAQMTGCQHVEFILRDIQQAMDPETCRHLHQLSPAQQEEVIDEVARMSVLRTVCAMVEQSETLARLEQEGRIAIVGAMYDVVTGQIEFLANGAGESNGKREAFSLERIAE
jgi:carbonic anhydrase